MNSDSRGFSFWYEANSNYLWEVDGGICNVIAIFGDDDDCKKAAIALNAKYAKVETI